VLSHRLSTWLAPVLSSELRLALAPVATYRMLMRERTGSTWLAVLARPAFFMLLVGTLVAMIATRRVTIGLVLTIALSWSFSLLVQAAAGGVIIASAPARAVGRLRAFELLFLGHAPWSLWMLTVTALAVVFQPYRPLAMVGTLVIPVAWTAVIVSAFCQTVLHTTKGGARRRTLLHQLIVWGGALGYVSFAVGGWATIFKAVGL
jgi:hypothetical protein